LIYDD